MKKLKIFILTLLMVLTILPVNTLAENQFEISEYEVYATKDDLMNKFAPDNEGSAYYYGKIIFGKNSKGNPQEWFVLGADSGVNERINNVTIFTTTSILDNTKFSEITSNKDYSYKANTGYGDSDGTVKVYSNHYGASDIRKTLNSISTNTDYFTSAEQGLMNSTTISTPDEQSSTGLEDGYSLYYKNTDKLYLPYTKDTENEIIRVGSNNQIKLMSIYYWKNENFWLRKGIVEVDLAYNTNYITLGTSSVDTELAVRPAANIDLTNVLFASAAKADGTGTIADDAAMTLRLDGSKKEFIDKFGTIGTVVYDSTNGIIKATKGSTDKAVTLVVQGQNGYNWCYSQTVSDTSVISVDDIMETLSLSDIKLDDCKIWLEISDDNVSYAVQATSASISTISSVDIKDIDDPKANAELDLEAICDTTGIANTKPSVKWNTDSDKADYYAQYTASVELIADMAHIFADTVSATINSIGENVIVVKNSNGTLTVSYTFPKTNDKLVSATNPDPITVENGTALEDMKLPETVTVETVGKSVNSLEVKWILDQITDYDPSKKELQEFTIQGTVELPKDNSILPISNDGPATVEIKVTVKAVEIIPTPPANEGNTYDDGGPFTTDICGNIYDRWGNKIYTAPGCRVDDGYVVPNTGVK